MVSDDKGELSNLTGYYDANSNLSEVTLSGGGFPEELTMDYQFESEVTLKLTFSGSDLENLGVNLGKIGSIVSGLLLTATLERRSG